MLALAFRLALLLVSALALWRGRWPERLTALMYLAAAIATQLVGSALSRRYVHVEFGMLAVDFSLLLGLTAVALRTNLWWLLISASLQLVVVLGHLAKLLDPGVMRLAYAWMIQSNAFPSLILLLFGVVQRINQDRAITRH